MMVRNAMMGRAQVGVDNIGIAMSGINRKDFGYWLDDLAATRKSSG